MKSERGSSFVETIYVLPLILVLGTGGLGLVGLGLTKAWADFALYEFGICRWEYKMNPRCLNQWNQRMRFLPSWVSTEPPTFRKSRNQIEVSMGWRFLDQPYVRERSIIPLRTGESSSEIGP